VSLFPRICVSFFFSILISLSLFLSCLSVSDLHISVHLCFYFIAFGRIIKVLVPKTQACFKFLYIAFQGHEDWVQDVCFSVDQNNILSASKVSLRVIVNYVLCSHFFFFVY
jgi:WD40 repeat protein